MKIVKKKRNCRDKLKVLYLEKIKCSSDVVMSSVMSSTIAEKWFYVAVVLKIKVS